MIIQRSELEQTLTQRLEKYGMSKETAKMATDNFVENSLYGVYSHGVNRFPRVISYLKKGYIIPENVATCEASMGALEKWNGNLGMGNSNATICMDRAVALAKTHGIGCVALRNTNHWMRGGAFGIQAAKAGCVGICWTNTQPNMPAWGAKDRRIGNNPLVLCVPDGKGGHVMVDGAMAQFSYGAIESTKLAGKQLPVVGGYDSQGELTCDPAEIEKTWRVLPIGFWKGSSFSIVLDMVASLLSGGNTTTEVGRLGEDEYALSQLFIAIHPSNQGDFSCIQTIIQDIKASELVEEGQEILYPCEKEQKIYAHNMEHGIPVHDSVWEEILAL